MKPLYLLPILLLTGCGYTRAEYEAAAKLPVLVEFDMPNGDRRVVYGPDYDPQINPVTGHYTCKQGVRVVTYRDGVAVAKWFQEHGRLKP